MSLNLRLRRRALQGQKSAAIGAGDWASSLSSWLPFCIFKSEFIPWQHQHSLGHQSQEFSIDEGLPGRIPCWEPQDRCADAHRVGPESLKRQKGPTEFSGFSKVRF